MLLLLLLANALAMTGKILLAHRVVPAASTSLQKRDAVRYDPGIYVLQFKSRIDAAGVRRASAVLGYELHQYVPQNGLLVHINSTEQALALQRSLDARMARLVPLVASDRQAQSIGTPVRVKDSQLVFYRNNSNGVGQPVHQRHSASSSASSSSDVVLRGRLLGKSPAPTQADIDRVLAPPLSRNALHIEMLNDDHFVLENIHVDDAAAVADALVRAFHNIVWIERRAQHRLLNRWAVPVTERRGETERANANWQSLYTGAGRVVAISDTGVAVDTCYFSDGLGTRAGPWPRVAGTAIPSDTKHPRVRAYSAGLGGDYGDTNGHGTHVAGTLVGRANTDGSALFNGVAPNAKLVVWDLDNGHFSVPSDIGGTIFEWARKLNADVHSGSWGAATGLAYDIDCWNVDFYLWRNRGFTAVFAAGNDGPGAGTVVSPAKAKNVIAVAATMNGKKSLEQARGPVKEPADTYSPDYIADFSARGSPSQPFDKPDVAAPGASYVWSAAYDAPKSGSCNVTNDCILGIEGTSMSTPLVAGAAVLIYEALAPRLETPVTSSLVRAMLFASAVPTRGHFPNLPYRSASERRYAEGAGRVVLDQILNTNYKIISNERADLALVRAGDVVRVCVAYEGVSPERGALPATVELVVVMVYTDYPSTAGVAVPALVNDLDLLVRVAANATAEVVVGGTKRSTWERVILSPARTVDISVIARSIEFGGPQTFSLLVALRGAGAASAKLVISTPRVSHGETAAPCAICGTQFLPRSDCVVCGDGVISEPQEECEPSISGPDCCDAHTCMWLPTATLCSTQVGACRVQGRCSAERPPLCVPSSKMAYRMSAVSGACEQSGDVPPESVECAHSVDWWTAELRRNGTAYANEHLCCEPVAAIAEQRTPTEPLYHALAMQYIAGRLNAAKHVTSEQLVALRNAQLALEQQCASPGFTRLDERDRALELLRALEAVAGAPCKEDAPSLDTCEPLVRGTELSELLCFGPPARYLEVERRCACGALQHPGEPDCRHLACSANGASVFDYTTLAPRCSCLPGWTGASCQRCEAPPLGTRYICIGLPTTLATRHVLRLVSASTVAARIDGNYYPSVVQKLPDALPGNGALDCACRTLEDRILPEHYESHRVALEASLAMITREQLLWAATEAMIDAGRATTASAVVRPANRATSSAEMRNWCLWLIVACTSVTQIKITID